MKHPQIRAAVLAALKAGINEPVTWFDGRPAVLDPEDLPALAVYITDAYSTAQSIDEDLWQAVLHIEVFLKAAETDSALDEWMESRVYPHLNTVSGLGELIETMSPQGYDYQRDDEMATWGSADLQYSLSYIM